MHHGWGVFFTGLKVDGLVSRPLLIYYDNASAFAFAMNNNNGSWSRHISIKFLRAKDRVCYHLITFEHIRTESMIANHLTKALPVLTFIVTKLICSISIITCITRDTILIMIPIVGKYGDPHRRPQAHHEIDCLEHIRWILKDIRRRTHILLWFGLNLAYVHGKRI